MGVEVPYRPLLEGTVSQRQLHEVLHRLRVFPARACGVEARDEPQHRTKVKPRKAGLAWVSVPSITTPDIQPRQDGNEDGGGGTLLTLTQGDLRGSAQAVGGKEVDDDRPKPTEKSDLLIVARKAVKAAGAKGKMG